MSNSVKTCFTLMLIFSLAILPLRMAFAMPIDDDIATHEMTNEITSAITSTNTSNDHCANMRISSTDTSDTQSSNTNCCGNDSGDCSSCLNNAATMTTELNIMRNQPSVTEAGFSFTSLQPQAQTPPFRPPQTIRI